MSDDYRVTDDDMPEQPEMYTLEQLRARPPSPPDPGGEFHATYQDGIDRSVTDWQDIPDVAVARRFIKGLKEWSHFRENLVVETADGSEVSEDVTETARGKVDELFVERLQELVDPNNRWRLPHMLEIMRDEVAPITHIIWTNNTQVSPVDPDIRYYPIYDATGSDPDEEWAPFLRPEDADLFITLLHGKDGEWRVAGFGGLAKPEDIPR